MPSFRLLRPAATSLALRLSLSPRLIPLCASVQQVCSTGPGRRRRWSLNHPRCRDRVLAVYLGVGGRRCAALFPGPSCFRQHSSNLGRPPCKWDQVIPVPKLRRYRITQIKSTHTMYKPHQTKEGTKKGSCRVHIPERAAKVAIVPLRPTGCDGSLYEIRTMIDNTHLCDTRC